MTYLLKDRYFLGILALTCSCRFTGFCGLVTCNNEDLGSNIAIKTTRSSHVETVILLVKQKPDDYLRVTFDLEEKDVTSAEKEATYQEIKNYINFRFGASVSTLYISQIKRKCGLPVKEAYNKPEVNKHHVPSCPAEKEFYIMDALRYFKMIR